VVAGDILVASLPEAESHNWASLDVRHVVCDSRRVVPGDLFVAVPGVSVDGHDFIPAALTAGAVAFVVERLVPELAGLPTLIVPDAREAYAHLQAAYHGHPGRRLGVIGVTGTDGKTTTTRLIASILRAAGHKVGYVDTVSARIGDKDVPTGFHTTTPDAAEIQSYLAEMVEEGVEFAIVESTSHGLAQHRVTACEYDVAVVTNITHEHLDYHGTYEAYRDAKAMLFRALGTSFRKEGRPKIAVLNADDSSYPHLRAIPADVRVSYGLKDAGDVRAADIVARPDGLRFVIRLPEDSIEVFSPLVGGYNVYNVLAAASAAWSQGLPCEAIRRGVADMRGVQGRMEEIVFGQPFKAIIDFAHTPNALLNALNAARSFTDGRVIVVFGCAGLRDRGKRPLMGEAAGRLADVTVITAEDPRTESLDDIMEQIAGGCRRAGGREGQTFLKIGDRAQAIERALAMARPGDTVIITGKGHERSMCFGTTEYPWSDHQVTEQTLRRMGYERVRP